VRRVRCARSSNGGQAGDAGAAADASAEQEREGVLVLLVGSQVSQLGDELRAAAEEFGNGSQYPR
jgi:hypothetical protein